MILILTNSGDSTADYLESKIEEEGLESERIDTDKIESGLKIEYTKAGGQIFSDGRTINTGNVDGLWYRRPKEIDFSSNEEDFQGRHISKEWAAALSGILELVPFKRWINHPTSNASASHKIEQIEQAYNRGLNVPDTLVTQRENKFLNFWGNKNKNIIVKPLSVGYIEKESPSRDSIIYTREVKEGHIGKRNLLKNCPTLFQEKINKKIDIRINVIDEKNGGSRDEKDRKRG